LDQAAPISARPTRTRWLGAFSPVALVGDDAHVLGLDAEGDDFAGEFVRAGLLEGADGRHCKSPFPYSSPHHCGLDGDRQVGGDRRRTPKGLDR